MALDGGLLGKLVLSRSKGQMQLKHLFFPFLPQTLKRGWSCSRSSNREGRKGQESHRDACPHIAELLIQTPAPAYLQTARFEIEPVSFRFLCLYQQLKSRLPSRLFSVLQFCIYPSHLIHKQVKFVLNGVCSSSLFWYISLVPVPGLASPRAKAPELKLFNRLQRLIRLVSQRTWFWQIGS